MRFIIGLVIAVVFVAIFRKLIKAAPQVFYILAILLDALLIASRSLHVPSWVSEYFLFLFQSNNLAMGIFVIVMFASVFSDGGRIKRMLLSIRGELSIIASLLCIGHIVVYGEYYLSQLLSPVTVMPAFRVAGTLLALLLAVLLIPLAITSIKAIRSRMSSVAWKRLQLLAYPFFVLICVHAFFCLLIPSLAGNSSTTLSIALYTALGAAYLILRIRQWLLAKDAKPVEEEATSEAAS